MQYILHFEPLKYLIHQQKYNIFKKPLHHQKKIPQIYLILTKIPYVEYIALHVRFSCIGLDSQLEVEKAHTGIWALPLLHLTAAACNSLSSIM